MTMDTFRHGTVYGYRRKGCRCVDCTRAQRDAARKHRADPDAQVRHRAMAAARSRAVNGLARAHREEFHALLDAEYVAAGLVIDPGKPGRPRTAGR